MKSYPEVIIFDIDGVLVDVRGSFHRTVIETVRFFTGKRVTRAELHHWKSQSGFNDDWKLSTAWVQSLGGKAPYEEVKSKFVQLYWGSEGTGNVIREKWLLPRATLRRLVARSELALFTGRVRQETDYTLDRLKVREFFREIVTVEDVEHPKPNPEGLLKILAGRDPARSLYLGDNIDDALAAQAAHIPFAGVLPQSRQSTRVRREMFVKFGARVILKDVQQIEPWLKSGRFTRN
ncbi:MAG TPA: HAD family hydrolase [Candidatus Acidoferrales bacterium]|jgi:HAD superfamily hydrolase (TIGR01548 family)|nr:HAD family hydrolase [Candidatus Acidoferrales bacterium]